MQEQYIKLSDLYRVKGIGGKTIDRIKETLLQEKNDTYNNKNINYKDTFDLPLNNFYIGESVEWMQDNMPSNFVDLTVTSPPYSDLRNYKGFLFNFECIAKELYRITKESGIVVWVVGDKIHNGGETLTPFKQGLYFKDIGFNMHDTMIYQKNAFPFPDKTRYAQVFEYVFVLSKGNPKTTNIKQVPTKVKNRNKNKKSSYRTQSGEVAPMLYTIGKDKRNKENIWLYEVGYMKTTKDKIAYKHPAQFPEQLAEDHILSWSNGGDIVFDPMCGAGTTCKMAWLNNRKFIGVDCSEEYINDICIPRLKDYGWNPNNHQYNNKGDI